jgi:hypothetical protein
LISAPPVSLEPGPSQKTTDSSQVSGATEDKKGLKALKLSSFASILTSKLAAKQKSRLASQKTPNKTSKNGGKGRRLPGDTEKSSLKEAMRKPGWEKAGATGGGAGKPGRNSLGNLKKGASETDLLHAGSRSTTLDLLQAEIEEEGWFEFVSHLNDRPASRGRRSGAVGLTPRKAAPLSPQELPAEKGSSQRWETPVKVVVVDLRKKPPDPKMGGKRGAAGEHAEPVLLQREAFPMDRAEPSGVRIFTPYLNERPSSVAGKTGDAAGEQTLTKFRDLLQDEVVKHTRIVLRNENSGELRLSLKPESLGSVRINLSLNNNHIEGRIIVENNIVKQMFESNLQDLSNAFKEDGFASASLSISVGGQDLRDRDRRDEFPAAQVAEEYAEATQTLRALDADDLLVDLVI